MAFSLQAQVPYASWETGVAGWTDQSGGAYTYAASTKKGVTTGSSSLACTSTKSGGWTNLISNADAAVRTGIAACTSIKLDVYFESTNASSATVTLAFNGDNAGGTSWTQLESKNTTLNGQATLTWDLTAAQLAVVNKSTSWFQFWIIVQTDGGKDSVYYLDNLRFASAGTAPAITTQPSGASCPVGGTATFSVAASGTAPLAYQWYANGLKLSGGTEATLNLPCVQSLDAGAYQCLVSNGAGYVTSASASLTVTPATALATAAVSVDAGTTVRVVDERIFGVNTAVWDAAFDGSATEPLLRAVNMRSLRFPGGSSSDLYHWNSAEAAAQALTFDEFAVVANKLSAHVYITANYGSGTASEAAEWVRYSNITKKYGFKYWEVGNECYGSWENDTHAKKWDPVTYANEFKAYAEAMKAVDPSIKVGAVVTNSEDELDTKSPANQYVTNPRTGVQHKGWTAVVLATLKSLGVRPDFIIDHRYDQQPAQENDASLLQSSKTWADDATRMRQMLSDYLGAGSEAVEIIVTENNSVTFNPGKQTTSLVNALFLADSVGNLLQTEINGLQWWDLRNGQTTKRDDGGSVNLSSSLYGWRQYGDYGLMSATNDCYPTYYAFKLLSYFARGGDSIVKTTSNNPLLATYAARRTDGTLSLIVINKSPSATTTATFTLAGYTPAPLAPVYTYGVSEDRAAQLGAGHRDLRVGSLGGVSGVFSASFLPYSVSVITLYPAGVSSRLSNLSVRALTGTGSQMLVPGFVFGGEGTSGSLPLLIRGDGLSLVPNGVPAGTALEDPQMTLYQITGSTITALGSNDDWGGSDEMKALYARLWAYTNSANGKDAALYRTLPTGSLYTAEISGKTPATGVALAELFDASENPTATTPRLVNISGRAQVSASPNDMVAGFVISGSGPKTVLIRAVGPSLSKPPHNFNGTVLSAPQLDLHHTRFELDEIYASNSAWGGSQQLKTVFSKVWASAFPDDASKDAVLLVTLPPGVYTAIVKGVGTAEGVALVEVFEVE